MHNSSLWIHSYFKLKICTFWLSKSLFLDISLTWWSFEMKFLSKVSKYILFFWLFRIWIKSWHHTQKKKEKQYFWASSSMFEKTCDIMKFIWRLFDSRKLYINFSKMSVFGESGQNYHIWACRARNTFCVISGSNIY